MRWENEGRGANVRPHRRNLKSRRPCRCSACSQGAGCSTRRDGQWRMPSRRTSVLRQPACAASCPPSPARVGRLSKPTARPAPRRNDGVEGHVASGRQRGEAAAGWRLVVVLMAASGERSRGAALTNDCADSEQQAPGRWLGGIDPCAVVVHSLDRPHLTPAMALHRFGVNYTPGARAATASWKRAAARTTQPASGKFGIPAALQAVGCASHATTPAR